MNSIFFFVLNDTTTTDIYRYRHPLSQHDSVPISKACAAKPAAVAETAKPPAAKKPEGQPAETRKPEKPALTKPAIAPQASRRHFDKERSAGGLLGMMLVLGVIGGGLALWIELGNETAAPPAQPAAVAAAEAPSAAPEAREIGSAHV